MPTANPERPNSGPVVLELTVSGSPADTQKVINAALAAATAAALDGDALLSIKLHQPDREADRKADDHTTMTPIRDSKASTEVLQPLEDVSSSNPSTSATSSSETAVIPAKRVRLSPSPPSDTQNISVAPADGQPPHLRRRWFTIDLLEDVNIVFNPPFCPSFEYADRQTWSLSILYEPQDQFFNEPCQPLYLGGVIVGDDRLGLLDRVNVGIPIVMFDKIWSSISKAANLLELVPSRSKTEIVEDVDLEVVWVPANPVHTTLVSNPPARSLSAPGPMTIRQFRHNNKKRHFVANVGIRVQLTATFGDGSEEPGARECTVNFWFGQVSFVGWR